MKNTNKHKEKNYRLKYYQPRDTAFSLNNFQMCENS